jgi:hypothetical protein
MKYFFFFFILLSVSLFVVGQSVFKNPGISASETFEITDYIDDTVGYVTAKIDISLKERNNNKYYSIDVEEGGIYSNKIEANYNDLTTIFEKRTDLRSNTVVEDYENPENKIVHFYNKEKGINKNFNNTDRNIYSRYAFFFSFRGFPFDVGKSVTFESYMFEYGDALTMKVTNVSKQFVTVKAGTYECYKLELSVAGWRSLFASDKFYLYFAVTGSHPFIKYEEKESNGIWNANELVKIN